MPPPFCGQIQELFLIAEEALNVEIDRDQGEQAIGRRDEEPPTPQRNGANGQNQPATNGSVPPKSTPAQEPPRQQQPEAATNKQVDTEHKNSASFGREDGAS